jgi:hypothetical protein
VTWPLTNPGPGAGRGGEVTGPSVTALDVVVVVAALDVVVVDVARVVWVELVVDDGVVFDRPTRVVVVVADREPVVVGVCRGDAAGTVLQPSSAAAPTTAVSDKMAKRASELRITVVSDPSRMAVRAGARLSHGERRRRRRRSPARRCANIALMLTSQLCSLDSLTSPALRVWSDRIRPTWDPDGTDPKEMIVHRKMWEWLFICEALSERHVLREGSKGVGFGVGREPLVPLFASLGCRIMATDLDPERAEAEGWTATGEEYTGGIEGLNEHGLCDAAAFKERVEFRFVDMKALPDDLRGFDFSWSSCAFEHLGSLEAGLTFVERQMDCLRPGGVAVHTTEYNLSSDDATVSTGGTVLYRRRDLEELVARLRSAGHTIECEFTEGQTPADRHIDLPPFSDTHLRTMLGEYVTTSIALIIEKRG